MLLPSGGLPFASITLDLQVERSHTTGAARVSQGRYRLLNGRKSPLRRRLLRRAAASGAVHWRQRSVQRRSYVSSAIVRCCSYGPDDELLSADHGARVYVAAAVPAASATRARIRFWDESAHGWFVDVQCTGMDASGSADRAAVAGKAGKRIAAAGGPWHATFGGGVQQ